MRELNGEIYLGLFLSFRGLIVQAIANFIYRFCPKVQQPKKLSENGYSLPKLNIEMARKRVSFPYVLFKDFENEKNVFFINHYVEILKSCPTLENSKK